MSNPPQVGLSDPAGLLLAPPLRNLPRERDGAPEVSGSMNVFISKVEPRINAESGRGLFAIEPIQPGEVIAAWGGLTRQVSSRGFPNRSEN